jgi:WD40 repeat protein
VVSSYRRMAESSRQTVRVAFSADGAFLASCGQDRTARLGNVATGASLRVLRGHSGEVAWVDFSPEQRTLATAGRDGTLKLWDIARDTDLTSIESGGRAMCTRLHSPPTVEPSQPSVTNGRSTNGKRLGASRSHHGRP